MSYLLRKAQCALMSQEVDLVLCASWAGGCLWWSLPLVLCLIAVRVEF